MPQVLRLGQLGKDLPPVSVYDFVPRYLRLTEAEHNWLEAHPGRGHDVYVEKVLNRGSIARHLDELSFKPQTITVRIKSIYCGV